MPAKQRQQAGSFSFSESEEVLDVILGSNSHLVVVCGQAVNFWAERYQSRRNQLASLQPFTSHDLDVLGNISDVYRAASATRGSLEKPRKGEATPVAGNVYVKTDAGVRMVQFLRHVPGVSKSEVVSFAVPFKSRGGTIYIADPIATLAGKLHNLATLNQRGRNDVKHIKILCQCVPTFLGALIRGATSAADKRVLLKHFERIIRLSASSDVKKVGATHEIDWAALIPSRRLSSSSLPKLAAFRKERFERWRARLYNSAEMTHPAT